MKVGKELSAKESHAISAAGLLTGSRGDKRQQWRQHTSWRWLGGGGGSWWKKREAGGSTLNEPNVECSSKMLTYAIELLHVPVDERKATLCCIQLLLTCLGGNGDQFSWVMMSKTHPMNCPRKNLPPTPPFGCYEFAEQISFAV